MGEIAHIVFTDEFACGWFDFLSTIYAVENDMRSVSAIHSDLWGEEIESIYIGHCRWIESYAVHWRYI